MCALLLQMFTHAHTTLILLYLYHTCTCICTPACTQRHRHATHKKAKAKSKVFWLLLNSHTYPVTSTGAPVCYSGTVNQRWQILLGRISDPQEAVPCLTDKGVGTRSPTWILTYYARHGQLSFASQHTHTPTCTHARTQTQMPYNSLALSCFQH